MHRVKNAPKIKFTQKPSGNPKQLHFYLRWHIVVMCGHGGGLLMKLLCFDLLYQAVTE